MSTEYILVPLAPTYFLPANVFYGGEWFLTLG